MQIFAEPLTAEAFAPYGQVLQARGEPDRLINQGLCGRFHDLAKLDFGAEGRAGISIFHASLRTLPYRLEMLERHPEGSQTFLPLDREGFLVTVALDAGGIPAAPKAFMTRPGQGINLNRGTWHGVLTPLAGNGLFAVVDRIGPGANLMEHWLEPPVTVLRRPDNEKRERNSATPR